MLPSSIGLAAEESSALRHIRPGRLGASAICALVAFIGMLTSPTAFGQDLSTGPFRALDSIETTFLRGVTTKTQVRQQLGDPNGTGAAAWAMLGGGEREIWYYEDVAMTGMKRDAGDAVKIDMRQQILLVLFKGDLVDGYLWTTNKGLATAR